MEKGEKVEKEGVCFLQGEAAEAQVHVVYGMAKDFGVSGLRVGALASRNRELLDAHTNLVQKTKKLFEPFLYWKRSFYQARLGTNIRCTGRAS